MEEFTQRRRQKYIDETSYKNRLKHFSDQEPYYRSFLSIPEPHVRGHARVLLSRASDLWDTFQLRYTAGENLDDLARSLDGIVDAYDQYVRKNQETPEDNYLPPFRLIDMIDTYVDFLNMVSAVVLLHREDLLSKIFGWIKDGEYDGIDAVLEELLNFYFPDRPSPDQWLWKQPYEKLLAVIDASSSEERRKLMAKYIKHWYPAMKGKAAFWGKHTEITPDFSPYFGYWAMCAAAFTYLLDIDDTSYRNEEVYPGDMVDYARAFPRRPIKLEDGTEIIRVEGGQACPREGRWFSPAKADSIRYFKVGAMMPVFEASEYGQTIWQWVPGG